MTSAEAARDRLRNVIDSIAELEEDSAASSNGGGGDVESQVGAMREMHALRKEKKALTAEILQVLGLRPNDSLSDASRGCVPPPSGALGGRNGSGGRWLPKLDRVRMLPPMNRPNESLPRLASGDYDADVVRPTLRDQPLTPPPSWRPAELTPVKASNERTSECRAGPCLEHSVGGESATEDRAMVISSRPWTRTPLSSPAGNASNGGGGKGSNSDIMLDAGAGWGNVMDAPPAHAIAAVPCGALRYPPQVNLQQHPESITMTARPPGHGSGLARGNAAPMAAGNCAVVDSEPWPNADVGGEDQRKPHRLRGSPAKRDSTPRVEPAGDEKTHPWEHPWREEAPLPLQQMKREFGRYSPLKGKWRRATSDDSGDTSPRGRSSPNASSPWASVSRRGEVGSGGSRDGRLRDGVGLRGSSAPLPKLAALYDVARMPRAPAVGIVRAHSNTTWQSHGAGTQVASPSGLRTMLPAVEFGSVPAGLGRGGWRDGDGVTSGRGGSSPGFDHHYPHLDHLHHPIADPSPSRVGRGDQVNFGVGAQPLPPVAEPTPVSYPLYLGQASRPTGEEGTKLRDAIGPTGSLMAEGRALESLASRRGAGKEEAGAGSGALRMQAGRAGEQRRESSDASTAGTGSGRGCQAEDCDRRPIYAYKGSKKAAYCARHRMEGMVDTRHPLCKNEQCTRQPSFGMEGDRRASYCAEHKLAGMINVASRRCQHPGCLRHPNFGFPGDRRASYCSGHRELGMVDIVSRRCRDPSCGRRPLYNIDGLRPVCCSQHKAPGMIDVVSTRCQEPGCFCHPSFGYTSDKKARRCARHRLENMEGVKGHKHKRRKESTASRSTATAASTVKTTPSSTTTTGAPPPSAPAVPPTQTPAVPSFPSLNSLNARAGVGRAVSIESMGTGRGRGGGSVSRGEGVIPVGVGGSTRRVGVSGPGGMTARFAVARV